MGSKLNTDIVKHMEENNQEFDILIYPPYFLHEDKWSNFWYQTNFWLNNAHQYFLTTQKFEKINYQFLANVYQYPWIFNWILKNTFLYVPKAGGVEEIKNLKDSVLGKKLPNNSNNRQFQKLTKQAFEKWLIGLINLGKTQNSVFIKLDIDDQLAKILQIDDLLELTNYIQNILDKNFDQKLAVIKSNRSIQYLQTMTLDLETMNPVGMVDISPDKVKQASINSLKTKLRVGERIEDSFEYQLIESGRRKFSGFQSQDITNILVLKNFYDNSSDFWAKTSQKVRRYTRKALEIGEKRSWQIEVVKGGTNQEFSKEQALAFDHFYWQYLATSNRQNFAIQPRIYLMDLFAQSWSYIIFIKDGDGEVLSVWMGIESQQTLTYLYGGNSKRGLDSHSQYLIQLVAMALAKNLGKKFYDLGGYDTTKGFGQFKDGYKGQIRNFIGVIDIILKPRIYYFLDRVRSWIKRFLP